MYLIYDCSSISKPTNFKASFTDVHAWPRMVHLSWILLGEDLKPIEDFDGIVKPEKFVINEDVLKHARIDQEDVDKKAIELEELLEKFTSSVRKASFLFSHNQNFNESIVAAEYMRAVMPNDMFKRDRFCLMHEGTYYTKIPARGGGYKWPTLNELHIACFKQAYAPTNNARADVIAAARCFIKLMKTGAFEDLFE
jgi:DNA polymerase III epsilon subunit-like protein